MIAEHLPLFRFGVQACPLGCISGPLIYDSGEAENTFFFRCQERFPVYNALSGFTTLVFVMDTEHRDRYESLFSEAALQLAEVSRRTGIPLPRDIPRFYVPLDVDELEVHDPPWYFEQPPVHGRGVIFNQVSPSCARIFNQLEALERKRGAGLLSDEACAQLAQLGNLALRFHDKSEYVGLTERSPRGLPEHARTIVLDLDEFMALEHWEELGALFGRRGVYPAGAYYVKSAMDSGGNAAALLTANGFGETVAALKLQIAASIPQEQVTEDLALDRLRADIELSSSLRGIIWSEDRLRTYVRRQLRRRQRVRVLVQSAVETAVSSVPKGIGIMCTTSHGAWFASGQLYRDPQRKHFLGSYVSPELSDSVLTTDFRRSMLRLCDLFVAEGFTGPLGFDGALGPHNQWVLLYDCNPRLTGVYPALTMHKYLRRAGMQCNCTITLGYRGEWSGIPLEEWLDRLASAGVLYGENLTAGIIPLPNISRKGGCDLIVVNVSAANLSIFLEQARIAAPHFESVY